MKTKLIKANAVSQLGVVKYKSYRAHSGCKVKAEQSFSQKVNLALGLPVTFPDSYVLNTYGVWKFK